MGFSPNPSRPKAQKFDEHDQAWPQSLQKKNLSETHMEGPIQVHVTSETPFTVVTQYLTPNTIKWHLSLIPEHSKERKTQRLLDRDWTPTLLQEALHQIWDLWPLKHFRQIIEHQPHKNQPWAPNSAEDHHGSYVGPVNTPITDYLTPKHSWRRINHCKYFREKANRTMGTKEQKWHCIMSVCTHRTTLFFYFKPHF